MTTTLATIIVIEKDTERVPHYIPPQRLSITLAAVDKPSLVREQVETVPVTPKSHTPHTRPPLVNQNANDHPWGGRVESEDGYDQPSIKHTLTDSTP